MRSSISPYQISWYCWYSCYQKVSSLNGKQVYVVLTLGKYHSKTNISYCYCKRLQQPCCRCQYVVGQYLVSSACYWWAHFTTNNHLSRRCHQNISCILILTMLTIKIGSLIYDWPITCFQNCQETINRPTIRRNTNYIFSIYAKCYSSINEPKTWLGYSPYVVHRITLI